MAEIRVFRPGEWRAYRDIRLASLQDAPDAFGSTYEESLEYPDEAWEARLAAVDVRLNYPVAAFEPTEVVALAWGRIHPDEASIAILNQMWTKPAYRGRGLAKKLVEAVIAWAGSTTADVLELDVTQGNAAAKHLYESLGFKSTGDLEPLREGSTRLVEKMRLPLR